MTIDTLFKLLGRRKNKISLIQGEGKIIPILWHFRKVNFTYLGKLWCRSRRVFRHRIRRGCQSRRRHPTTLLWLQQQQMRVPEQTRVPGLLWLAPYFKTKCLRIGTIIPSQYKLVYKDAFPLVFLDVLIPNIERL